MIYVYMYILIPLPSFILFSLSYSFLLYFLQPLFFLDSFIPYKHFPSSIYLLASSIPVFFHSSTNTNQHYLTHFKHTLKQLLPHTQNQSFCLWTDSFIGPKYRSTVSNGPKNILMFNEITLSSSSSRLSNILAMSCNESKIITRVSVQSFKQFFFILKSAHSGVFKTAIIYGQKLKVYQEVKEFLFSYVWFSVATNNFHTKNI